MLVVATQETSTEGDDEDYGDVGTRPPNLTLEGLSLDEVKWSVGVTVVAVAVAVAVVVISCHLLVVFAIVVAGVAVAVAVL